MHFGKMAAYLRGASRVTVLCMAARKGRNVFLKPSMLLKWLVSTFALPTQMPRM